MKERIWGKGVLEEEKREKTELRQKEKQQNSDQKSKNYFQQRVNSRDNSTA